MAGDLISTHEVRLLLVFQQQPGRWFDNAEVAQAAKVSPLIGDNYFSPPATIKPPQRPSADDN